MDPVSHRLANALVGNDRDAATLEITLIGPELEFDDERLVAVAGAEFELTLDGRPTPMQRAVHRRGRIAAALRRARRAARARTWRSPAGSPCRRVLGSRATHLVSGMGGVGGRALRAGDRLPLGDPRARAGGRRSRRRPPTVAAAGSTRARSGVLPGPQLRSASRRRAGCAAVGAVRRSASNRIAWDSGSRVRGCAHARGADIISDATPLGVAAGARLRAADPADGRSPDDRRLSEDRDGHHRRHRRRRAARRRATRFRSRSARRREAMAALIAQERALMAVEARRT